MKNNNYKSVDSENNILCENCKSLIGKGRYDPAHNNLVLLYLRENKLISGKDDEYYYSCKICLTNWRHETCRNGEGWRVVK